MTIYKYQRITTPGPNGTTYYFRNTDDNAATELAEVGGFYYAYVPDGVILPDQHAEIGITPVTLTPELKESIKTNSPHCRLISDRMQTMIRDKYPIEEEQYYSRIGVGVALGAYTFQVGEQDALLAFGAFVESIRQWGRDERAKIGL